MAVVLVNIGANLVSCWLLMHLLDAALKLIMNC